MVKLTRKEKKAAYFKQLIELVENKSQALIVGIDHVGSSQMQQIRIALRGKATLLMGKNTMIRTCLRQRFAETEDEGLERLVSNINGNIGFVFLEEGALDTAREVIEGNKVPAMAKAGVVAPVDVYIPSGPSGLEPSQTSFFQALNIPTKIVKGMIEITSDVHLVKKGEKVSLSAQALLAKLGIKPFEYGMQIQSIYQEGAVFDAAVLDITDAVLIAKFLNGVSNVAALGREIGIPTEAGLPHMMCNAFKNLVATVVDIDFGFEQADEIKAILTDPEALAKMQAAAAAAPAAGGAAAAGAPAAAAAAPVEEEEEDDMEFDLFD